MAKTLSTKGIIITLSANLIQVSAWTCSSTNITSFKCLISSSASSRKLLARASRTSALSCASCSRSFNAWFLTRARSRAFIRFLVACAFSWFNTHKKYENKTSKNKGEKWSSLWCHRLQEWFYASSSQKVTSLHHKKTVTEESIRLNWQVWSVFVLFPLLLLLTSRLLCTVHTAIYEERKSIVK